MDLSGRKVRTDCAGEDGWYRCCTRGVVVGRRGKRVRPWRGVVRMLGDGSSEAEYMIGSAFRLTRMGVDGIGGALMRSLCDAF